MPLGFDNPYLGLAAGYFANRGPGTSPMQALGGGMQTAMQMQMLQKRQEREMEKAELALKESQRKAKLVQNQEKYAEQVAKIGEKHGPEVAELARARVMAGDLAGGLKYAQLGRVETAAPKTWEIDRGLQKEEWMYDPATGEKTMVATGPRVAGAGTQFEMGPDGTMRVSMGGPAGSGGLRAPLAKPQQSKVQENLIRNVEARGAMAAIRRDYDPKFLTLGGQAKRKGLKLVDYLTELPEGAGKQYLINYRKFSQGVNREFNAYRKYITGAAAAMSELLYLKDSMINMDLGPAEMEGAMQQYEEELQRVTRIKNKLLREGLDVSQDENSAWGQQMDLHYASGGDDDPNVRAQEVQQILQQQGVQGDALTKQIRVILKSEGYI